MLDKNGKLLELGDRVKIFTYYKGVIVEIKTDSIGEECAVVQRGKEETTVYKEEICKTI